MNESFIYVRPKALVKWSNRPYAILQYDLSQPGLYFGIVLLSTCEEWWTFVTPKAGEYCRSKSPELTVNGKVIYIGSYKLCLENYSHSAATCFREPIDNGLSCIGTPLLRWCPIEAAERAAKRAAQHIDLPCSCTKCCTV